MQSNTHTDRELIIAKALKIKELADRGMFGEKQVAIHKFDEYCEKHKITEAELKITGNEDILAQYSFEELVELLAFEVFGPVGYFMARLFNISFKYSNTL